jgi:hypothetical protein
MAIKTICAKTTIFRKKKWLIPAIMLTTENELGRRNKPFRHHGAPLHPRTHLREPFVGKSQNVAHTYAYYECGFGPKWIQTYNPGAHSRTPLP